MVFTFGIAVVRKSVKTRVMGMRSLISCMTRKIPYRIALFIWNVIGRFRGTPFPTRFVLADLNRVRDALLSLDHSKSYLCGSDFKIGQAHKHLHLTKYIYNKGIQAFSK